MEIQRWWVLKSKIFGQESTFLKEKKFKNSVDTVCQKLGMILENKMVQKLKLETNAFFYKKWSPKLIFLYEMCFFEITR